MQEKTSRSFFKRMFGFLMPGWTRPSQSTIASDALVGALPAAPIQMLAALDVPEVDAAETVTEGAAVAADRREISVVAMAADSPEVETDVALATVPPAASRQDFHLAQRLTSVERLNRPASRAAQRPARTAPAGKPIPKAASGKRSITGALRPTGRLIAASVTLTPAPEVSATAEILIFPRSKVRSDMAAA